MTRVGELLADSPDSLGVELVLVNAEDHYAAPGEVHYLGSTDLTQVRLPVNVDAAGFRGGPTAYEIGDPSGLHHVRSARPDPGSDQHPDPESLGQLTAVGMAACSAVASKLAQ